MDEQQKMLERYKERLNKCVTMSKKLLIEKVSVHVHLHTYVYLKKTACVTLVKPNVKTETIVFFLLFIHLRT